MKKKLRERHNNSTRWQPIKIFTEVDMEYGFNLGELKLLKTIAEEDNMISSPCENCHKKNQPKENCADDCEILNAVQLYQVANGRDFFISAIDYAEEGRFCLNSKDVMI